MKWPAFERMMRDWTISFSSASYCNSSSRRSTRNPFQILYSMSFYYSERKKRNKKLFNDAFLYFLLYNLCKLFGPHVHGIVGCSRSQSHRETVGQILHDDLTSVPSTCSNTKTEWARTENVKSLTNFYGDGEMSRGSWLAADFCLYKYIHQITDTLTWEVESANVMRLAGNKIQTNVKLERARAHTHTRTKNIQGQKKRAETANMNT